MKYSASTRGFYDNESVAPSDAVDVPDDTYRLLLVGQTEGFEIVPNSEGFPELRSPDITAAQKAIQIKSERDRRKIGGVRVGDKWFHSDDGSRIQQIGLVMMGAGLPAGLQWKTMDGSFITMTPALAQQVFTAQAASDQTIFAVAEAHRVALAACPDPAKYDYLTGWPKVFGEK